MSTSTDQLDSAVEEEVRRVLVEFGKLSVDATTPDSLPSDASLWSHGLTSHASVTVMLGCEDAFDVEFPQRLLTKQTFSSVASIVAAVREVQE
ncbi:acyl carrier protein [Nocardioides acrostichi]|uniref:Acyl carrier protein n=1 Tax=Nocardioides acrostichi TaxID=2784339 RepID=A0A930UT11_9ACTN|nr:acyl carrier protein [Nocardioides acrostichi]MBF4160308.1 acyl carrier protein [Nocardioides acrostichi]